jgi:hypothetical protein
MPRILVIAVAIFAAFGCSPVFAADSLCVESPKASADSQNYVASSQGSIEREGLAVDFLLIACEQPKPLANEGMGR